ncbi:AAA family ATPase [Nocardioides guangzhouensis]|uniref:AAA family ATPase n=1 Tax=Nocardioides guangzhouensis TaxID=2497878 RepID=UPI001438632E|nr:LuxR family transcriptional regulator [Nocardioides guangzhouensis]
MGREAELHELRTLLADAAAGRCRALLVEGEPGVGKTTLLGAARSLADGFTVLTARGVEAEAGLAHAGLLELLRPVRDLVAEVPDTQAAALGSALGWSPGPAAADGFLVAAATLSLLAARAERGPVLVLVDDLQWVDRESAAAILFAARRLGPDPVAFLLAGRSGTLTQETPEGVPVLSLGGLAAPEATALLPAGTAHPVLEALVAGTGGNPLALLEAGRRLDDAQRIGAAPLPDPLPPGERLNRLYRATLGDLSPAARRAVLLLALSGTGDADLAAVATVLVASGVDPAAAWDEARGYGVLVRDGARHGFRHPLIRSTVLEDAGTAELVSAHAALAAALPAGHPARVWHRASAATGTEPAVAEDLALHAAADRVRLGHAAASLALERASALTPDPDLAARRLAEAAHDAFLAGDVARVRALVDRVLADGAPDDVRGEALLTLGTLEQYAGSVPRSVEHLTLASSLLTGPPLVRALAEQAMARFRLNDVAGFATCADQIDAVADPDDPEQRLLAAFCGGVALMLAGDLTAGPPRLAEVRRLADLPKLRADPRALLLTALAAGFTGEVGDAMTVGAPRVEEVRRRGTVGLLVPLLAIRAAGRAWLGDHAGAFADAGEAAELAHHLGYAADASVAVEMTAWQQAARGLHDDARASLDRARALTDRAGTTGAAAHQALTAAFCALCRDDLPGVVTVLEARLAVDGGVGAVGEPLGVAPLLVEAYVGLGRLDDARALAARFAEVTPPAAPPLSVALVHRCHLLTAADDATARASFDAAVEAHSIAWDPFEAARTRLLFGGGLRRAGERVAAREHLAAARDVFASMDLTHSSTRADQELAATGATARRRTGAGEDAPLTSQETRVALLAAQGRSNKEIAASLFLSPRTVERHLGNVFRKRGFRTRTELAATFVREAGPPVGRS